MKKKIKTIACITLMNITIAAFAQSSCLITAANNDPAPTRFLAPDKATNFLMFLSYWPSLIEGNEQFEKKHTTKPSILCGKCTTKALTLGEFTGGLIGKALKSVENGEDSVAESKMILDDCVIMMKTGSISEIVDFMVRVANQTKQVCSHCRSNSNSWRKI